MEWTEGELALSDDPARLDMEVICQALQESYWASGRPREVIEESFRRSLCFGLYEGERLIGFTRVVGDKVVFSWICDVWITPEHRGRGLGTWMLERVLQHPDVVLTRQVLVTQDAQPFYEKLGFERRELMLKPAKRPYR